MSITTTKQLFTAEVVMEDSLSVGGTLTVGGNEISAAEIAALDGVTAGTVTASKALIVDASSNLSGLNNVTLGQIDTAVAEALVIAPATATAVTIGASDIDSKVLGTLTMKTAHTGLLAGAGTSGAKSSLGATAGNALSFYLDATHTTGDMRGEYMRLYFSGAGGSGEAARIFSTINNVSVATGGTVNGAHISIGTAGASAAVSGAANALRCTFGIAAASVNIGGTCATLQLDTDFDTAVTVPPNFAFIRFVNLNTKKSNALFSVPAPVAETAGLFCAHITDAMTHSLRIVDAAGTAYYVMCTTTATNRTVS